MSFRIVFTEEADYNLKELKKGLSKKKRLKAVRKSLGYLETNPKHPSLNTHEYNSLSRQFGIKVLKLMLRTKHHKLIEYFGITGRVNLKLL